jgi:hypothetical protein
MDSQTKGFRKLGKISLKKSESKYEPLPEPSIVSKHRKYQQEHGLLPPATPSSRKAKIIHEKQNRLYENPILTALTKPYRHKKSLIEDDSEKDGIRGYRSKYVNQIASNKFIKPLPKLPPSYEQKLKDLNPVLKELEEKKFQTKREKLQVLDLKFEDQVYRHFGFINNEIFHEDWEKPKDQKTIAAEETMDSRSLEKIERRKSINRNYYKDENNEVSDVKTDLNNENSFATRNVDYMLWVWSRNNDVSHSRARRSSFANSVGDVFENFREEPREETYSKVSTENQSIKKLALYLNRAAQNYQMEDEEMINKSTDFAIDMNDLVDGLANNNEDHNYELNQEVEGSLSVATIALLKNRIKKRLPNAFSDKVDELLRLMLVGDNQAPEVVSSTRSNNKKDFGKKERFKRGLLKDKKFAALMKNLDSADKSGATYLELVDYVRNFRQADEPAEKPHPTQVPNGSHTTSASKETVSGKSTKRASISNPIPQTMTRRKNENGLELIREASHGNENEAKIVGKTLNSSKSVNLEIPTPFEVDNNGPIIQAVDSLLKVVGSTDNFETLSQRSSMFDVATKNEFSEEIMLPIARYLCSINQRENGKIFSDVMLDIRRVSKYLMKKNMAPMSVNVFNSDTQSKIDLDEYTDYGIKRFSLELLEALDIDDINIQFSAAQLLLELQIGMDEIRPIFERVLLESKRESDKWLASYRMGQMGLFTNQSIEQLCTAIGDHQEKGDMTIRMLDRIDESFYETLYLALLKLVDHPISTYRYQSIRMIGDLFKKNAKFSKDLVQLGIQKVINRFWKDSSEQVRRISSQTLCFFDDGKAIINHIIGVLNGIEANEKVDALKMLGKLNILTERLLKAYLKCFDDDYEIVRLQACKVKKDLHYDVDSVLTQI